MDVRKYMYHGIAVIIIAEWLGMPESLLMTLDQAAIMDFAGLGFGFSILAVIALSIEVVDIIAKWGR